VSRGIGRHPLGVAAHPVEQPDDARAAAHGAPHEFGARDERQGLGGEVGVLDLVGVGEVDPRGAHLVQLPAGPGLRLGQVDDVEDLRPAEPRDLHSSHAVRD
jgi:hypothetical protein